MYTHISHAPGPCMYSTTHYKPSFHIYNDVLPDPYLLPIHLSLDTLHLHTPCSLFVCSRYPSWTPGPISVQHQTHCALSVWYCPSIEQLLCNNPWTLWPLVQHLTSWTCPSCTTLPGSSLWTWTHPLITVLGSPHRHSSEIMTCTTNAHTIVISFGRYISWQLTYHSLGGLIRTRFSFGPWPLQNPNTRWLFTDNNIPPHAYPLLTNSFLLLSLLSVTAHALQRPRSRHKNKNSKRPPFVDSCIAQTPYLQHSNPVTSRTGRLRTGRGYKGTTRQRLRFRDSEEWQYYHTRFGESEMNVFCATLQYLIPGAQPRPGTIRLRHRHARIHRKRWHQKHKTRLQKARAQRQRLTRLGTQPVHSSTQTYHKPNIKYKYSAAASTTPPARLLGGATHVPSCHPDEALWEYYVIHAHQKQHLKESNEPPYKVLTQQEFETLPKSKQHREFARLGFQFTCPAELLLQLLPLGAEISKMYTEYELPAIQVHTSLCKRHYVILAFYTPNLQSSPVDESNSNEKWQISTNSNDSAATSQTWSVAPNRHP